MVWLHNPWDIRTLLSKEGSMPILPSMNTFIELRQEDDYQEIFHEGTGLISQVFDIFRFVLGFDIFPGRDLVQVPPSSSEGHDVT